MAEAGWLQRQMDDARQRAKAYAEVAENPHLVDELRATIERLTRERDEALLGVAGKIAADSGQRAWQHAVDRVEALLARAEAAERKLAEAQSTIEELRAEAKIFDDDHAEQNRMVDAIADLCGVPHDEELNTEHVRKAIAEARAAAIEEAAKVLTESAMHWREYAQRQGNSPILHAKANVLKEALADVRALAAAPEAEERGDG